MRTDEVSLVTKCPRRSDIHSFPIENNSLGDTSEDTIEYSKSTVRNVWEMHNHAR